MAIEIQTIVQTFDATLGQIQRLESFPGGWAAMWQADTLQARIRQHADAARDVGLPVWEAIWRDLHAAIVGWGSAPSHAPDPRVADILAAHNR